MKTTSEQRVSRKHKILCIVALIGLFACGFFVGNSVYFELKPSNKTANPEIVTDNTENLSTCQQVEKLLTQDLNDPESREGQEHRSNYYTYMKMAEYGCPENQKKFLDSAESERVIAAAYGYYVEPSDIQLTDTTEEPCRVIERVLSRELSCLDRDSSCDYQTYLYNAKVYSTMAEKGCPENAQKNKKLALDQLQIASALDQNKQIMYDEHDTETVIDTYKKLQMMDKAYEVLNKVRKMVEPTADFIQRMEKVINE